MSLSATDRLDILDLYARASYYLDFGEPEKFVALFTADGVLVRQTGDEVVLRHSGAAELLGFAQGVVQRNGRSGQHWISNVIVESSSEGAIGTCHSMMVVAFAETRAHQITSTGQCRDRFTRTAAGWRFKERVFVQRG